MTKPPIRESRFDFRGGRNSAVSVDLLSSNELVDASNARLVGVYGAFQKRSGTQRIHPVAFPAAVRGVCQWDSPTGNKQTIVIANGDLYYRDGTSFEPDFSKATLTGVARSTAAQGSSRGWLDPDGTDDGKNALTQAVGTNATVAAGNRLVNKIGDPAVDNNPDAADDLYNISFKVTSDGTAIGGVAGACTSDVTLEVSTNGGGLYTAVGGLYRVSAGKGQILTQTFNVSLSVAGTPTQVWFRLALKVTVAGSSGTGTGTLQCFETAYLTDNFPSTWVTGAARFSTTECAVFAPFRASAAGAPLWLFIASGGHYFKWDGSAVTQLDPTNAAPPATSIISYHTRMFAMTAHPSTAGSSYPGENPKTIFWSKIGDAENFTVTGLKSDGGAAVTDFLTGQHLTALEVIGSSLLMATIDSIMRFQGHSSDDIVISQDTEGISAEVGCVGPQALRRFENVAAFLALRGPYVATETSVVPIGEKVLPDFDALQSSALADSTVIYNRGRKELLFIVPGAADGGSNKTVFVYAPRLQAWYGPWTYSFAITCATNYLGSSGIENVLVGCADGFVRLLDSGAKDDILYDGTGGSNITMTVEMYVNSWRGGGATLQPGTTRALSEMALEATLPSGSALQVKVSFDGAAFSTFSVASAGPTELNYRVGLNGQGKRMRLQFVDASAVVPTINAFVLKGWEYGRP